MTEPENVRPRVIGGGGREGGGAGGGVSSVALPLVMAGDLLDGLVVVIRVPG